jgi:hypothetical protein
MNTNDAINFNAKVIARIIEATDTDHRHELYDAIAAELSKDPQHFTAKCFRTLAQWDRGEV